jgi:hypothetical protein
VDLANWDLRQNRANWSKDLLTKFILPQNGFKKSEKISSINLELRSSWPFLAWDLPMTRIRKAFVFYVILALYVNISSDSFNSNSKLTLN